MIDKSLSDNDRALERHSVNGDIDVYDSLRDIYIGRLVNVHAQGLMIIGDIALDEDRLYEIDMHIPTGPAQKQLLRLGVDCLWMRSADQNGKIWTGFSIIDMSPKASEEIRRLIEVWGHNE
ncbi:MAG: PilZ domain-containing protein [Moraxellaceae bacterium]|nr:MAG: PilZ domain-containing protein [Moraxellaceae bacterium]